MSQQLQRRYVTFLCAEARAKDAFLRRRGESPAKATEHGRMKGQTSIFVCHATKLEQGGSPAYVVLCDFFSFCCRRYLCCIARRSSVTTGSSQPLGFSCCSSCALLRTYILPLPRLSSLEPLLDIQHTYSTLFIAKVYHQAVVRPKYSLGWLLNQQ